MHNLTETPKLPTGLNFMYIDLPIDRLELECFPEPNPHTAQFE